MGGRRRRSCVEPTDDWEQLKLLCMWPEQLAYEEIRPLTLFGNPVPERARKTGAGERTLYRRLACFKEEGVEALFGSEHARRKRLPRPRKLQRLELDAFRPLLPRRCRTFSRRTSAFDARAQRGRVYFGKLANTWP